MNVKRAAIVAAMLSGVALSATACHAPWYSSSGQNVPVSRTISPTEVRYNTPGHFPAVVMFCTKAGTGVYVAESQGGAFALAHDPDCAQPVTTRK